MTGEEIANATPWEIQARLKGYARRMKHRRIFTASFLTAPIINGGVRAPKKAVTAKKLLPEDFQAKVSKADMRKVKALIEKAQRGEKIGN